MLPAKEVGGEFERRAKSSASEMVSPFSRFVNASAVIKINDTNFFYNTIIYSRMTFRIGVGIVNSTDMDNRTDIGEDL